MAVQSGTTNPPLVSSSSEISQTYQQGLVAGLIGAATIALWFFIVDLVNGRPFFTPNVLGMALFRGGASIEPPTSQTISLEMVLVYTWVHGMIFCLIGGLASRLLALAERDLHLGFGILLPFGI